MRNFQQLSIKHNSSLDWFSGMENPNREIFHFFITTLSFPLEFWRMKSCDVQGCEPNRDCVSLWCARWIIPIVQQLWKKTQVSCLNGFIFFVPSMTWLNRIFPRSINSLFIYLRCLFSTNASEKWIWFVSWLIFNN